MGCALKYGEMKIDQAIVVMGYELKYGEMKISIFIRGQISIFIRGLLVHVYIEREAKLIGLCLYRRCAGHTDKLEINPPM